MLYRLSLSSMGVSGILVGERLDCPVEDWGAHLHISLSERFVGL
jgi:hypothetical protein